ncbi:hypothetical protein Hypma_005449 [Hypsizygus marmoreus]|uniref:Uncharacterized protein n=1 Tax=Hypsizygus marmoreus TaxID=39966 RepID=A0A369J3U3_HYPMA|nr:hypothetical protein Hypma_005449 [Hypsizygus marmoreus]
MGTTICSCRSRHPGKQHARNPFQQLAYENRAACCDAQTTSIHRLQFSSQWSLYAPSSHHGQTQLHCPSGRRQYAATCDGENAERAGNGDVPSSDIISRLFLWTLLLSYAYGFEVWGCTSWIWRYGRSKDSKNSAPFLADADYFRSGGTVSTSRRPTDAL